MGRCGQRLFKTAAHYQKIVFFQKAYSAKTLSNAYRSLLTSTPYFGEIGLEHAKNSHLTNFLLVGKVASFVSALVMVWIGLSDPLTSRVNHMATAYRIDQHEVQVGSFKLVIRLLSALSDEFQLTGTVECKTQSFFGKHCTNIYT